MSSNASFSSSFSGGSGTLQSGDNFTISVAELSDPDGFSGDPPEIIWFRSATWDLVLHLQTQTHAHLGDRPASGQDLSEGDRTSTPLQTRRI